MKISVFLFLALTITFAACKKNTSPEIHPVQYQIKTSYASKDLGKVLPLLNVRIVLKNTKTNINDTLFTKADGIVPILKLSPGVYDITASITIPAAQYTSLTNEIVDKEVVFNGSVKNQVISLKDDQSLQLDLVSGSIGPWVIKQIYYAGSNSTNGALFRDQFIEFYNNTDSLLYADSLYFAEAIGIQNYTSKTVYRLENQQYDWSKSQDMPGNIDANNGFVYARTLLMIPGTGKQYPVKAGESIILAQTAINHKSPFTGTDGKTISVRDPSLTVDLSGADFEAYYAPFLPRPLASDIDNPNVPNVEVIAYNGTDLIFDNPGRIGYVIFRNKGTTDVKNLKQYAAPSITPPSSTAEKYYQIPVSYIIDAVETQPYSAASRVPKKLGASLDAGYTFVPAGAYSSQSVIRKTEATVNGRKVLKDTNNSLEDFDFLPLAAPRAFK